MTSHLAEQNLESLICSSAYTTPHQLSHHLGCFLAFGPDSLKQGGYCSSTPCIFLTREGWAVRALSIPLLRSREEGALQPRKEGKTHSSSVEEGCIPYGGLPPMLLGVRVEKKSHGPGSVLPLRRKQWLPPLHAASFGMRGQNQIWFVAQRGWSQAR